MSEKVLAIDAGTTNVTTMIVAEDGQALGRVSRPFRLYYPGPGLVEQDPDELWTTTLETVNLALREAGLTPGDIVAIGITGQRTTIIVWEAGTGRPLGRTVSWQDQRGAAKAGELAAAGFPVNAITAASKMELVLDGLDNGRDKMKRGELAWGNVDSFLAWKLSGGGTHATDFSNACTTGYYDYFTGRWNEKLIERQGLTGLMFPRLVDTSGPIGTTSRQAFGAEALIGAIIGDQQSAAYGQGCLEPGQGKVTFGTSATCDVNTGGQLKLTTGTYPLILWRRDEQITYCLEGMIITAGAVFDWLASGLGLLPDTSASAEAAGSVPDCHGVSFLPALQGLGTPYNLPGQHGAFHGLTLGVRTPHLVRAAMEGVAFRLREMLDRLYEESKLERPAILKVDGGAAANDVLMQIQANILGCAVERMAPLEATAYGAAILAGEACGIWPAWASPGLRRTDRIFEPQWNDGRRDDLFIKWRQACGLDKS